MDLNDRAIAAARAAGLVPASNPGSEVIAVRQASQANAMAQSQEEKRYALTGLDRWLRSVGVDPRAVDPKLEIKEAGIFGIQGSGSAHPVPRMAIFSFSIGNHDYVVKFRLDNLRVPCQAVISVNGIFAKSESLEALGVLLYEVARLNALYDGNPP